MSFNLPHMTVQINGTQLPIALSSLCRLLQCIVRTLIREIYFQMFCKTGRLAYMVLNLVANMESSTVVMVM